MWCVGSALFRCFRCFGGNCGVMRDIEGAAAATAVLWRHLIGGDGCGVCWH